MWIEDTSGQHFTATPGLFPPGEALNMKPTVQTALVGVNYKFHGEVSRREILRFSLASDKFKAPASPRASLL
jgi:hypothetical protein